jgi:hypothetical protein
MAKQVAPMTNPSEPEPFDDATLEQLNAYLDGEMNAAASAAFEDRLAREPGLRSLLDTMRGLDTDLSASLGAVPSTPPSDALLAAVKSFAAAQTADATTAAPVSNVVAFEPRKAARPVESKPWQMPLAAAIALCVGAGGMWLVQSQPGVGTQVAAVSIADGIAVKGGPLHNALETVASGDITTAGAERIRPILSFAAKDGRYCREFESFGAQGAVVGVACKGDRGWAMEVVLAAAAHAPNETQYAPASGFNAKALDDVVSQLIDGQPMTAEAEAAARGKAWQKENGPKP